MGTSNDQWGSSAGNFDKNPETTEFEPVRDSWSAGQPQQPAESYWAQAPADPTSSPPAPSRPRRGWAVALLALLLVLVLLAGLGFAGWKLGWFDRFSGDKGTGQTVTATATIEEGPSDGRSASQASSEPSRPSKVAQRPNHVNLPSTAEPANPAARANEPTGNFNSVWRGSSVTSEAFAQAVREAYARHYVDTKQTSGTVDAFSPVTGVTYTMDCRDNGSFVTCTGGNDAVVIIA